MELDVQQWLLKENSKMHEQSISEFSTRVHPHFRREKV